jgi:hypothetical protein
MTLMDSAMRRLWWISERKAPDLQRVIEISNLISTLISPTMVATGVGSDLLDQPFDSEHGQLGFSPREDRK